MDEFHNRYEMNKLIGEGSFGKVYKAECRCTKEVVACKIISKFGRCSSEIEVLRKECEIQKNLDHPNIIRMLHSFETETELIVVTEYAEKDLCQILKDEGVLQENIARKIICDIIFALYYLHEEVKVLHRDLKPQNVLLDFRGVAKVCDFGFAKVLKQDDTVLTSIKGTPLYMAPELISQSSYNHKADLWSLGCISYELVTGHTPFTATFIWQLIKMITDEPIKWPFYLSKDCLSFLKGLLQKNPDRRLCWPELLDHAFVKDHADVNGIQFRENSDSGTLLHTEIINVVKVSSSYLNSNDNFHLRTDKKFSVRNFFFENNVYNIELLVQKEEWLEFLQKTVRNVMYDGDVDVLLKKHSLRLIMNIFNDCDMCPVIITTVTRLLSLPFVVEFISEVHLTSVKQAYVQCEIVKDLLTVVGKIVLKVTENGKITRCHELALQQLFLLICYLIFTNLILLRQFFDVCVYTKFFRLIRNCLSIRTQRDPFSIVKYIISIFLRLYLVIPESQPFIFAAFGDCTSEFYSLLHEFEDITVQLRLCTFITVLCSTQSNFLKNLCGIHLFNRNSSILKK